MIQLRPLSQHDFEFYRKQAVEEYQGLAAQVGKRVPVDYPLPGKQRIEQQLPQGVETPNHSLYEIAQDDGTGVGVLWVDESEPPQLKLVRDILIYSPYRRLGYAAQALDALERLLAQTGVKEIQTGFFGEQEAARGLFAKVGYAITNLYMLRDLSLPGPQQTRPVLPARLECIDEETFQAYQAVTIHEYAKDKIQAGNWRPENALELAQQEFAQLLPEGCSTSDHHLLSIFAPETGKKVGVIWWGPLWESKVAYLWDFVVYEAFRGQGYAKAALLSLDDLVRAYGLSLILLHVFAHNTNARALYEKMGYWNSSYFLSKKL